jgi:hypothetical protein
MTAVGQLIGYVIGSIDTVSIFGTALGDTQFKQMTVIAALALLGAIAVTSYSVKERILITARYVISTRHGKATTDVDSVEILMGKPELSR